MYYRYDYSGMLRGEDGTPLAGRRVAVTRGGVPPDTTLRELSGRSREDGTFSGRVFGGYTSLLNFAPAPELKGLTVFVLGNLGWEPNSLELPPQCQRDTYVNGRRVRLPVIVLSSQR